MVQWALNMASRPSIGTTPFKVMMCGEPWTGFTDLTEKANKGWLVEPLTPEQVQRETQRIVKAKEERRCNVLCRREAGWAKSCEHASCGELSH